MNLGDLLTQFLGLTTSLDPRMAAFLDRKSVV